MILNIQNIKQPSSVIEKIKDSFSGEDSFQEINEFVKEHLELPENHFLTYVPLTDRLPYLVVKSSKTGYKVRVMPIFEIVSEGSEIDGSAKYIFFVNVSQYLRQLKNNFKDCDVVFKHRFLDCYHFQGSRSARLFESETPSYYHDPHF